MKTAILIFVFFACAFTVDNTRSPPSPFNPRQTQLMIMHESGRKPVKPGKNPSPHPIGGVLDGPQNRESRPHPPKNRFSFKEITMRAKQEEQRRKEEEKREQEMRLEQQKKEEEKRQKKKERRKKIINKGMEYMSNAAKTSIFIPTIVSNVRPSVEKALTTRVKNSVNGYFGKNKTCESIPQLGNGYEFGQNWIDRINPECVNITAPPKPNIEASAGEETILNPIDVTETNKTKAKDSGDHEAEGDEIGTALGLENPGTDDSRAGNGTELKGDTIGGRDAKSANATSNDTSSTDIDNDDRIKKKDSSVEKVEQKCNATGTIEEQKLGKLCETPVATQKRDTTSQSNGDKPSDINAAMLMREKYEIYDDHSGGLDKLYTDSDAIDVKMLDDEH